MTPDIKKYPTSAHKPDSLNYDEIEMLRQVSHSIHVDVGTALGLLRLLHTNTALDSDAFVLVSGIEAALQKIGLMNQRSDNLVHPGNLGQADAAEWLNVLDAWASPAPMRRHQEGGAA